MWEALIKLVEKWACMHDFVQVSSKDFTDSFYGDKWSVDTYTCTKCGKFKQIKSK